jgi:hypothetical protein
MVNLRMVSLAAMLAFAAATPVSAEWWKVGASGGGGAAVATTGSTARKPPVQSTAIPEPADFALFAAGVIGLLLGRRGSRSRKRRDDAEDDK